MISKLLLILSFFFSSFAYGFTPTVVIDAADGIAPVSARASGYLYGLAEYGVPSELMAESLDIASASQKVTDGLQHPTGDIDHVAPMLDKADYLVVYLQDCFSTWYYENDRIAEERREGKYDPQAFLENEYFPRVRTALEKLSAAPYANRIVLCLYNECDNGVWFGETKSDGDNVWGEFNENGRDVFFDAWRQTCFLVRSAAPGLCIGGPGYYEYNVRKERDFLTYCRDNGCMPDVMIYHELSETSSYCWEEHAAEYRDTERELGIGPLPVIVTEYGTMKECGNPAEMLPYVCAIERSGDYGDIAFWRLANNLNDNAADGNMPNACWWLYRWYTDLDGVMLRQKKRDLFHGDFEKAVKAGREMKYRDFSCLATLSMEGDRLTVLCGDCAHTGQLMIRRLNGTALGKTVRVTVEEIQFKGLSGAVTKPLLLRDENVRVTGGTVRIPLKDMTEGSVYRVVLSPPAQAHAQTDERPVRYEAERGKLLGGAYAYRSACAATGDEADLVGGMEREGDGVALTLNAPREGEYELSIIYGKHNDGEDPAGRVSGKALMTLNGASRELVLPNTIKSEYTNCLTQTVRLEKGKNTLRFSHLAGTFVLDSVLLSPCDAPAAQRRLAMLPDADRSFGSTAAFLTVAPDDGYYEVFCDTDLLTVDGASAGAVDGSQKVYLRRGLNLLTLRSSLSCEISAACEPGEEPIYPSAMATVRPAAAENGVLKGIGSAGGEAAFTFFAPQGGDYRVTLCYSNNAEGGYHAYNVDLIETYFTVTVNGESRQVMCRNTYGDENDATVTFSAVLREGENSFRLWNDGSVRFDGRETDAPALKWVSVNPVCDISTIDRNGEGR